MAGHKFSKVGISNYSNTCIQSTWAIWFYRLDTLTTLLVNQVCKSGKLGSCVNIWLKYLWEKALQAGLAS